MPVKRADELAGCTPTRLSEAELVALTDVIESHENQRWPTGKKIIGGNRAKEAQKVGALVGLELGVDGLVPRN